MYAVANPKRDMPPTDPVNDGSPPRLDQCDATGLVVRWGRNAGAGYWHPAQGCNRRDAAGAKRLRARTAPRASVVARAADPAKPAQTGSSRMAQKEMPHNRSFSFLVFSLDCWMFAKRIKTPLTSLSLLPFEHTNKQKKRRESNKPKTKRRLRSNCTETNESNATSKWWRKPPVVPMK